MEWTKSASTYCSCNEALTANSMLATMFFLASGVVPEPAVAFFGLHVAPHAAVYRSVRISSNGQELPIPFSRANWRTLPPAVDRVLKRWTFQLRSLRVVTQSGTLASFVAVRPVIQRYQNTSKRLRAIHSGPHKPPLIPRRHTITVPSGGLGATR